MDFSFGSKSPSTGLLEAMESFRNSVSLGRPELRRVNLAAFLVKYRKLPSSCGLGTNRHENGASRHENEASRHGGTRADSLRSKKVPKASRLEFR